MKTNSERFWEKVDRSGGADACWLWRATTTAEGYGMFTIKGRSVRAHRWVYEQHVAVIPTGLGCLHRCNVRACVNPTHLYSGTEAENTADWMEAGGTEKIPRGTACKLATLTDEQVIDIRAEHAGGASLSALASKFSTVVSNVWSIVNGKSWKHLLPPSVRAQQELDWLLGAAKSSRKSSPANRVLADRELVSLLSH